MLDESSVVITKHSEKRTKNRLGLRKKLAEKTAQKAFDNGLTHAETKGGLRRFVDKLYLSYKTGNNIRIYHRYVYIFQGNILITILDLPKKFYSLADELQERRDATYETN